MWRPASSVPAGTPAVMVDLTFGADGVLRTRLLDMAAGRSGTVYKRWLDAQTPAFRGGQARRPRPVRRYVNAGRDGLGEAVAVLDAFHV